MLTKLQARNNIANNIVRLIQQQGIRQVDVARGIMLEGEDISAAKQRVHRYIKQLTDIPGEDLANLAEFFKVSTDYLLKNRPERNSKKLA